MESAFMFVEKWVETPSKEQGSHLDQLKRMVAERDAAIRKECADRAIEAIGNIPPSKRSYWDTVESALRAAIEGQP